MVKVANNPILWLLCRIAAGSALALLLTAQFAGAQGSDPYKLRNVAYDGPALGQYTPSAEGETMREPRSYGEPVPTPAGEWQGDYFAEAHDYNETLFLDQPPMTVSSGTWLRRGCWYTQQEFTMLQLSPPRQVSIAVDQVQANFIQYEINTTSSTFTYQPGARLTIGRNLGRDSKNRDQSVEFTFMGLFDWDTEFHVDAINPGEPGLFGSLRTVLGGGGSSPEPFVSLDSVGFTNSADMNSYEINVVTRQRANRDQLVLRPDGSWVRQASASRLITYDAGLRLITLNNRFEFFGEGAFDSNGNAQPHSGVYTVGTHNDMFGIQGGGSYFFQHENWQWGFRGKGGLLVNFTDRGSRVVSNIDGVTTVTAEDVDKQQLTAMVEGGMYFEYFLRANLTFRCSYEVLYLQGLALAPEQLGLGSQAFPPLNVNGHSILQGGFFGFESVW